jgi:Pectate lyase superfamily protein/Right handed beta helix region
MDDASGISRRGFVSAAAAMGGVLAVPSAADAAAPDRAPLSARQFGAAGDGVADDTAALQAALDAAFDPNPVAAGTLVVPPGTYKVTRTLRITMRENCGRQRRLSAYGARLRSAIADGGHVLHIRSTVYWHFPVIEGLEIVGSGDDGHGLYLECDDPVHSLYNVCLRDLAVSGCGGDGCRLYGNVFESQLIGCTFRGNRGNGATLAHSLHGGVLSSIQLFGCSFDENEAHGAEIVRSYDVGFHGCAFRRNGRFGLLATNGCELVADCRFDDNHRAAFDFANGGAGMALRRYATLVGCTGHSTANQTHLLDADLAGSFARLVLIGCSTTGEGQAAAAGLARLRGASARPATMIGCQGRVTADGVQPLAIGGTDGGDTPGGVALASDWRSSNLLQLGDYRMWIDTGGRLRLKKGAPGADHDGTPV